MNMEQIILVAGINLIVRIFTVIFGGGGMILIPLLIFVGLPPSMAIATNRVGAQGSSISLLKFHRHGQVKWSLGFYLLIPALIGTIIGTLVVIKIDQDVFQKLIGSIMILGLGLLLYRKKIGVTEKPLTKKRLYLVAMLSLPAGFLGGLFALTGMWFTYLYLMLGLTFIQSAATRKIAALAAAIVSIIMLALAGLVEWYFAIALFISSAIGGWIGASISLKVGNEWIRRVFIVFVIASAIKLIIS